MSNFLQLLLAGIVVGSIYIVVAHSINVIYSTSSVLNFAHGELLMFGPLFALSAYSLVHSLVLAVAIGMCFTGLAGWILERVAVRPVIQQAGFVWFLSLLGLGLVYQNIGFWLWGRDLLGFPPLLPERPVIIGHARITYHELLIVCFAVTIMAVYWVFERRTTIGRAMKAVAYSQDTAKLMGINPTTIISYSFMIGGALAGLAGALYTPLTFVNMAGGFHVALKGFIVVIIGGLGSPLGAVVGGLLVGVAETLSAGYISGQVSEIVIFMLLIISLLIKPTGLFGKHHLLRGA